MSTPLLNRRDLIAALAATAAVPLMAACGRDRAATGLAPGTNEGEALALLDEVAENLLRLLPESATSLGIDTGARAALRSQLGDRSAEGQRRIATQLRADLERVNAVNTSGLSPAVRTSVEVVRSAYTTALEGFALPYGDIAVGGWRNTPYVVIQNVGAYLDVPRFLDSDHRIENPADAEAFLALAIEHRFVIQRKSDCVFLGMAGLDVERGYEFGYWLGKPFWGRGYATEAAHRLVTYAFEALNLESVHAGWFYDNPASGHVLAKLGGRHNGSQMRDCRARGMAILCHDMLLTRADFLRKQAA